MQLFLPLCPCLLLWKLLAVYSGTKKGRDLQLSYTNIVTVAISIYCFVKIDWTSAWSFTELIEAMLPQYRQEYRKVWVRECVCAQWILLALLYMIYRRTLVKLLKHNLLFVFKHCIRDVSSHFHRGIPCFLRVTPNQVESWNRDTYLRSALSMGSKCPVLPTMKEPGRFHPTGRNIY